VGGASFHVLRSRVACSLAPFSFFSRPSVPSILCTHTRHSAFCCWVLVLRWDWRTEQPDGPGSPLDSGSVRAGCLPLHCCWAAAFLLVSSLFLPQPQCSEQHPVELVRVGCVAFGIAFLTSSSGEAVQLCRQHWNIPSDHRPPKHQTHKLRRRQVTTTGGRRPTSLLPAE
jgi:hypothetical protein